MLVSRCYPIIAGEDELTPAEISALSRAGYGRNDGDGRFWSDDDKQVVRSTAVARDKGAVVRAKPAILQEFSLLHDQRRLTSHDQLS